MKMVHSSTITMCLNIFSVNRNTIALTTPVIMAEIRNTRLFLRFSWSASVAAGRTSPTNSSTESTTPRIAASRLTSAQLVLFGPPKGVKKSDKKPLFVVEATELLGGVEEEGTEDTTAEELELELELALAEELAAELTAVLEEELEATLDTEREEALEEELGWEEGVMLTGVGGKEVGVTGAQKAIIVVFWAGKLEGIDWLQWLKV